MCVYVYVYVYVYVINRPYALYTLTKRCRRVTAVHRPHEDSSTVFARGTLAARHKARSGSSTQEKPHVLVEDQKKPQQTSYSAPSVHIPALSMSSLRSLM